MKTKRFREIRNSKFRGFAIQKRNKNAISALLWSSSSNLQAGCPRSQAAQQEGIILRKDAINSIFP